MYISCAEGAADRDEVGPEWSAIAILAHNKIKTKWNEMKK